MRDTSAAGDRSPAGRGGAGTESPVRQEHHDDLSLIEKLQSSLEYVYRQRKLNPYFDDDISSRQKRSNVADDILRHLTPGAAEILTDGCLPSVPRLLRFLRSAGELSLWGCYLKVALPLRPDLPVIFYVGSTCGTWWP